jgi:hypothetical protein
MLISAVIGCTSDGDCANGECSNGYCNCKAGWTSDYQKDAPFLTCSVGEGCTVQKGKSCNKQSSKSS